MTPPCGSPTHPHTCVSSRRQEAAAADATLGGAADWQTLLLSAPGDSFLDYGDGIGPRGRGDSAAYGHIVAPVPGGPSRAPGARTATEGIMGFLPAAGRGSFPHSYRREGGSGAPTPVPSAARPAAAATPVTAQRLPAPAAPAAAARPSVSHATPTRCPTLRPAAHALCSRIARGCQRVHHDRAG